MKSQYLVIMVSAMFTGYASVAMAHPPVIENAGSQSVNRISGGEAFRPGEEAYFLSVLVSGKYACAAALSKVEGRQVAITAASCVFILELFPLDQVSVVAGRTDPEESTGEEQIRLVKKFILHPNFDSTKILHDVALIFLDRPFDLNSHVSVIPLAGESEKSPSMLTIIGWSRSFDDTCSSISLHRVSMPLESHDTCQTKWASYSGHSLNITENIMCAVEESAGHSPCGDLGSPARTDSNKLAAIFIYSDPYCVLENGTEYPALFTDLAKYSKWIAEQGNLYEEAAGR